jgi:hypothetical protein
MAEGAKMAQTAINASVEITTVTKPRAGFNDRR